MVDSYESVPELSGLTAVLGSDDFASALDRSTTLENATDGMQARHEVYDASADRAAAASDRAAAASADARQAQAEAAAARSRRPGRPGRRRRPGPRRGRASGPA